MNKICLFPFFFILSILNAQNLENYNEVYLKTYKEIAQNDFERALYIADSLFKVSETPYFKTRSLMLTATLYQHSGDLNKAIEYGLTAKEVISQTTDYNWITRVNGFLSTQYRLSGLYTKANEFMNIALESAEKIEPKESANSAVGSLYHEIAFSHMGQKEYKTAIHYFEKAIDYLNNLKDNKDYRIVENRVFLGECYYHLKEYKTALVYFEEALRSYGDLPESYLKGLIYNGIANVYIERRENNLAKENLDLANQIAERSNYLELKNHVYETSQRYYALTKDIENIILTKSKQDSVRGLISDHKTVVVTESFAKMDKEKSSIENKVSTKNKIVIVLFTIIMLGIMYFIWYRKQQKRNIQKIKEILARIDSKTLPKPINPKEDSQENKENSENEVGASTIMTSATEDRLLTKLEKFESSNLFTRNNVSLSFLATYCDTNTKYLSYVINTYKKQDFNNYINELRVNYIIKKLNKEPLYRKYKMATLAEEAGFSSQNKFATVFKKVTSISPSLFIKSLEEVERGCV